MKRAAIVVGLLCMSVCLPLSAADWPQWRGPFFNGSTDEIDLPETFSRTENVAWVADLPGSSAATPIVWGDSVFVSSTDVARNKLVAICLESKTGKVRWQHDVADGIRRDSRSNFAAPSPATDGDTVVFFYGNGDLLGFDLEGNIKWRRNIQRDYGQFAFLWTFSSSPVLYDGKLFLQVLQRDVPVDGRGFSDRENVSYLLAMDPQTGKTLWQQTRPSKARAESREAFSTPVPFELNGRKQLLVVGGDTLTAHDPETGKELWRWGTWNPNRITHWRHVTSPVAGAGVVLVCAPKRDPIYAILADGEGDRAEEAIAWTSRSERLLSSDVPTPAFYDGDFFILSDVRKSLSRVEPRSGEIKWTARTPGDAKYEASPTVGDNKVYLINFLGTVVVLNATDGRILHEVSMDDPSDDDPVRSPVVAAQGHLLIRTSRHLYCVGP